MYCKITSGKLEYSFAYANRKCKDKIMNAPVLRCETIEELCALDYNEFTCAVVTKTILEPCEGNMKNVKGEDLSTVYKYFPDRETSINRIGLKCNGWNEYYKNALLNNKWNKPVYISVAPHFAHIIFSDIAEYSKQRTEQNIIDLPNIFNIEINISCVNVANCADSSFIHDKFDNLRNYLKNLAAVLNDITEKIKPKLNTSIGIKLWPLVHDSDIKIAAQIILESPVNISFVTCCNTYKGYEPEFEEKIGGIGGKPLKAISLNCVHEMRKLLPFKTIIGCGGIFTTSDAFDYMQAGADFVQVGTAYQEKGRDIFRELTEQQIL